MNELNCACQRICLSYLEPIDILTLYSLRSNYFDDQQVLEWIWQDLCQRRWRDARYVMRISNSKSWKRAYLTGCKLNIIPRGIYSEKHNAIFGKGSAHHCRCWILLGHTPDCKPRRVSLNKYDDSQLISQSHKSPPKRTKFVTLHICLQNIDTQSSIYFDSKSENALSIFRRTEELVREPVQYFNCRAIAVNGVKIDARENSTDSSSSHWRNTISLGCFGFVMIAVDVVCGDDVGNEIDFLVQLADISLSYTRQLATIHQEPTPEQLPAVPAASDTDSSIYSTSCNEDVASYCESTGISDADGATRMLHQTITCSIDSEDKLWESYVPMPRDAILLRKDVENHVNP